MPYKKLNISGAQADVISWVSYGLTLEDENMLRNVSCLPCIYPRRHRRRAKAGHLR